MGGPNLVLLAGKTMALRDLLAGPSTSTTS